MRSLRRRLHGVLESLPYSKAVSTTVRQYEAFCAQEGHTPFPVAAPAVESFLIYFVRANAGSAKSLKLKVRHLKRYCVLSSLPWLSAADALLVSDLRRLLEFQDTFPSRQAQPLVIAILLRIDAFLSLSLSDAICRAMLWLGHDGLLRVAELVCGHKAHDFTFNAARTMMSLRLWRDKTHRSGSFVSVSFQLRSGPCAVRAVVALFDLLDLWSSPRSFVFPALSRRSKSSSVSKSFIQSRIKSLVALLGLNPRVFSTHSLRAGGATDLFVAKVPYGHIMKMGRWKSLSFLLYFRDTSDVRNAVFRAFESAASRPNSSFFE